MAITLGPQADAAPRAPDRLPTPAARAALPLQVVDLRRVDAGLRPPRRGAVEAAVPGAGDAPATRAVLFATTAAPADLPLPAGHPAALLPLGPATMIERQVESLARAQVKDIALVMCEAPERLRERLGDGGRWGVRFSWHVVKDPARPYALLRSPSFADAGRVVVGHADTWLDADVVRRLAERDEVGVRRDDWGRPLWTGWASGPASLFAAWPVDGERQHVERELLRASSGLLTVWDDESVALHAASDLLQHQQRACGGLSFGDVPAGWIRHPWGCASPHARIHPQARITGPALVGPGCVIEAGAGLGPRAWLGEDVVVAGGSIVRDAVVLPGAYVAAGLELDGVVVNGSRLRHLRHGVELTLPEDDGLLSCLHPAPKRGPGWCGRALAAGLALMLAPVAGPCLALAAALRRRLPGVRDGAGPLDTALAGWAMLAEVVVGRRTWFGVRARSPSQSQALHPEWQRLLADMPVGLLHEPAWADAAASVAESEAVADVYHASHRGWRENLRLVRRLAQRALSRRGRPATAARELLWSPAA